MDSEISYPVQAIARALQDGAGAAPPGSRTQAILAQAADQLADVLGADDRASVVIARAVGGRIIREMAPVAAGAAARRNPSGLVVPSIGDLEAGAYMGEDAFPPSALDEDLEA